MKIEINIQTVFEDPIINIESEDYPMLYSHLGKQGKLADYHGLQCSWLQHENPEKYEKLMVLCDQISDLTREIVKLHT